MVWSRVALRVVVRAAAGGLVCAVLVGLAGPAVASAHQAGASELSPSPMQSQGQRGELLLRDAVAALPVADELRDGYQRTKFKHWVDADKDGCNTRAEILLTEAVEAPAVSGRCTLTEGRWYSAYDDVEVEGPARLDIDHMVPLAEAWDSGAHSWTAQRRQDYANDLDEPLALIAVTGSTNRSKADQDPTTWLPPHPPAVCGYLTAWVTVKTRWQLAVDPAERQRLTTLAADCPNTPITTTTIVPT